jgi:group II intron reverse transcriptase/maturase
VLDADLRDFFGSLDHGWLEKFVEHRIADKRVLRLIQQWLKAGVVEDGKWSGGEAGTPQGAVVSPLLANVYLHYVFDQWAEQWRRRQATGGVVLVRYADDFVAGFQHREDAQKFLAGLSERLARFGLELKAEKTRLIEFGRYAAQRRQERGLGKPETFEFLGFTHICGKTRDGKRFALKRKTSAKKMRAKLKEVKAELMRRMHLPIPEVGRWLQRVVRGHHHYYAVPSNLKAIQQFDDQVTRGWLQALRRRSQTDHTTWERMNRLAEKWLPQPRVLHPYPAQRFAVRTQGKNRVR